MGAYGHIWLLNVALGQTYSRELCKRGFTTLKK